MFRSTQKLPSQNSCLNMQKKYPPFTRVWLLRPIDLNPSQEVGSVSWISDISPNSISSSTEMTGWKLLWYGRVKLEIWRWQPEFCWNGWSLESPPPTPKVIPVGTNHFPHIVFLLFRSDKTKSVDRWKPGGPDPLLKAASVDLNVWVTVGGYIRSTFACGNLAPM